jgi:phosphate:Na+ symporter
MNIFSVLMLFGGLSMFLYGMRLMGDGLKESSSGTLKRIMEHVTNNPVKAFLLGLVVTAVIQSSTATIVITAGLVGAGIISLHQSIGIIVGANVGTTVTGQIIRLLDVDASGTSWLQIFKPSTLAPVALIIGIVLIMAFQSKGLATVGKIAMGFGLLFSGLLNMTGAVDSLAETGAFERIFTSLGGNPWLGYVAGATVAFILQSSSAAVGILQALSMSGQLTFKAIYAVIVGIYLGDCVTTAIVCSIGTSTDTRRVGIINILFNLGKSALVLIGVTLLHKLGALNGIWDMTVRSGHIANANTIFNIGCSILLFGLLPVFEKLSRKILRDKEAPRSPYADKLEALTPAFFNTPALALNSCYEVLLAMLNASIDGIGEGLDLLEKYDDSLYQHVLEEESSIDLLADRVSTYMVQLSPHLSEKSHAAILDQYYKLVTEFERLGDHAENIAEAAADLHRQGEHFSGEAMDEIRILRAITEQVLLAARQAFEHRDLDAATGIEPMEEVVDDLVDALRDNHLARLRAGKCTGEIGSDFLDLLSDIERISDICSNVGVSTVMRINPAKGANVHEYISFLHSGRDEEFNTRYQQLHDDYFSRLDALQKNA